MNERYTFETLLEEEGYIVYTNVGFSMMPLLRPRRDVIEIHRKKEEQCRKYDVVLYKRGNMYILHRILKVNENGYVIAGDHNTFLEYDITDEQILGVMTRIVRNGKEIQMTDPGYRLYVHLWCDFYPVRMAILRGKAFMRRGVGKIKRLIGRK